MPQRTVVITGGTGFVGRHLLHELHTAEPETNLVVWDKTLTNLPAYVNGIQVDIADPTTYLPSLKEIQPTWIIHLAAIASIREGLHNPQGTFDINVTATRHLLESIVAHSASTRVLAISSADIYGQGSDTPLSELPLSQAFPRNPYAESKWQMEKMIEEEFLDITIRVRPFPHIGPGQRTGFVAADFASQIAAIEAHQQEPRIAVGNLEAYRDFVDVRDVVKAYRLLLTVGTMGEVYHVASGKAIQIRELLNQLLSLCPIPITVYQDQHRLRPSDIPMLVGDARKLTQVTGWKPTIPLSQTLQDILDFYRNQS